MWQRSEDILQNYTTKAIKFLGKNCVSNKSSKSYLHPHQLQPFMNLGDTSYQQHEAARPRTRVNTYK